MSLQSGIIRSFIFLALCILTACGGGGNTVSNSKDGVLTIERVVLPTTASGQGTVSVSLVAPTGGPGTGTISIASGDATLVAFSPASQSANSSGEATFNFTAKEVAVDTNVPFTVTVGSLSLTRQITLSGTGAISLTVVPPASADSSGSITAQFAGGAKSVGQKIAISSDKTTVAFDTTEQLADSNGRAVFSYRVIGITADTTITFTAKSDAQTASKNVLITASSFTPSPAVVNPQVNSIAFVSAAPTSISLKGTGGLGRTETSIVTFVIRDVTGQPLPGQIIDFTLDTSVGGITLVPAFASSDSAGIVKTIINAGVVSTPVRVTATVRNTSVSSKSDQLVISTGLPHQDGFSVAATTVNSEAWSYDGIEVPVTAMMSDHFGNPVPDGTAVYFMTYGGSIESNATTKNGVATVKWRSQNPRPADGKAKILAYAIGEESFTDLNGNGLADAGEFSDMPEAFLAKSNTTDKTKNHCNPELAGYNPVLDKTGCFVRDPGDPFIDFNGDSIYNTGDGKFNGVLQGNAYLNAPRSLHIFNNYQIVMSGSYGTQIAITDKDKNTFASADPKSVLTIAINPGDGVTDRSVGTNIDFWIFDVNTNPLPKGTTISISSTISGLCNTSSTKSSYSISPATFNQSNRSSADKFSMRIENLCSNTKGKPSSGTLVFSIKTPNGTESLLNVNLTY